MCAYAEALLLQDAFVHRTIYCLLLRLIMLIHSEKHPLLSLFPSFLFSFKSSPFHFHLPDHLRLHSFRFPCTKQKSPTVPSNYEDIRISVCTHNVSPPLSPWSLGTSVGSETF